MRITVPGAFLSLDGGEKELIPVTRSVSGEMNSSGRSKMPPRLDW